MAGVAKSGSLEFINFINFEVIENPSKRNVPLLRRSIFTRWIRNRVIFTALMWTLCWCTKLGDLHHTILCVNRRESPSALGYNVMYDKRSMVMGWRSPDPHVFHNHDLLAMDPVQRNHTFTTKMVHVLSEGFTKVRSLSSVCVSLWLHNDWPCWSQGVGV